MLYINVQRFRGGLVLKAHGISCGQVCLLSVQTREGHANLGSESEATASVAAMFYSFYNMKGPRPFLLSLSLSLSIYLSLAISLSHTFSLSLSI